MLEVCAPTAGVYARAAWCLPIASPFLFSVAQKERSQQSVGGSALVLYRIITEGFFGYEIQASEPLVAVSLSITVTP